MNKKLLISLTLGVLLSVTAVFFVLAGITNDIGTLELDPPVGKVNYTAWLNIYGPIPPYPLTHPPEEILTEDGFNPSAGEDGGFTEDYWQLNVGAFSREENSIPVNIQFGGLGDYSGTHWYYKFKWDGVNELTTHHTIPVPVSTSTGAACPRILPVEVQDTTKIVSFFGEPSKTYQIYRSTIPACEGCSNSNGRYLHLGEVMTDIDGSGIYHDNEPGITEIQSWYVVIYFDDNSYGAHGCHSEPVDPTNVVMGEFTAVYDDKKSAVVLEWETLSEINIVGFNVFRGTSEILVDSVKINTAIIPANLGSPVGDIYTYEDDAVETGQTYYYWIEILTNDMSDQTVGPESVTIPEPAWFYYFLPLLFN
ncbi:MAG TPA: hypothetical protein DCL08_07975 [Anaerolineaceae bacterium]|nr:MAG: Uncharacterized protein XE06_0984 [Anaerolineaceae bacterium 46_22]HAF49157.1 hypothetical protein [Anaerolineaceae bacterium]